jgi:hypothetical protein
MVVRVSSHLEDLSVSLPRLRAPKEHGQILAVPQLEQVGTLLEGNHRSLTGVSVSFLGKSLDELRALACREVLAASLRYHQEAGESVLDPAPSPPAPLSRRGEGGSFWLVAGHQPELFHPGVWFKNFALNQLARQHGALSLNLVIDTDTAKPALLHAPAEGRIARIPFDRSSTETPYEERAVEEETTFAELPTRMEPIVATWKFEPMLASFWREVMKQAGRTPLLGERLAAARRALERRWGCVQHEVPMSRVCQTEAFAWFACSILAELTTFHASYNQTVRAYRREHGIRSRSHPVPDLTANGDWLEAPFWAWRRGQTRRGRLFVRRLPSSWELRVGNEDWPSLPNDRYDHLVEAWRELETRGFKIRSRALTTTMFARLFLADVFIHGIGGGIYDELTDRLIESYFHIPAPGFLVLSATLLLPLPRFPDAAKRARDLARRRRDLLYKPELFLESRPEIEPLLRAKQEWIHRAGATHVERAERFERIREMNARMLPGVQPLMQRVQAELDECREQAKWDRIATRRDYAFCLYPEEMLRTFFLHAAGAP